MNSQYNSFTAQKISQKRAQFTLQIRKKSLRKMFSQQRALFRQQTQKNFEKKLNVSEFQQLIRQYQQNPCEETVQLIYKVFTLQNYDIDFIIQKYHETLLNMLLKFQDNIKCAQICKNTIHRGYQHIFYEDDQKYKAMTDDNKFIDINLGGLYPSQKFIAILYQLTDKKITKYRQTYPQTSIQIDSQKNQFQKQIFLKQKANSINIIRFYIDCIKEITIKSNYFVINSQFCQKYFQKWLKIFMIQCSQLFCTSFLLYSSYITLEQKLPFKTFRKQQCVLDDNQESQKQYLILNRFFLMAVPQNFTSKVQNVVIFSSMFIYNILQNESLSIKILLDFSQKIFHLIKLVINHQNTYSQRVKNRSIQYLKVFSSIINNEIQNNQEQQFRKKLSQFDMIESFKKVDFFALFKVYLMTQRLQIKVFVYEILFNFVKYVILKKLCLKSFLDQDTLYYIVIGTSDSDNIQASIICLKLIAHISNYATKNQELLFKAKMIQYGIEMYLQNLAYHKNRYISQLATQILEEDFSEQERQKCTALYKQSIYEIDQQYQKISYNRIPRRSQIYE